MNIYFNENLYKVKRCKWESKVAPIAPTTVCNAGEAERQLRWRILD
jgi:hypothetical protein